MRKETKYLILHCSDSDYKQHDDISVIREWHIERGFSDVGYHFFIKRDGTIQEGRELDAVGAHCKGLNNKSIGICLHGKEKFTPEQFEAAAGLCKLLRVRYSDAQIKGHYEYSTKTCPNFDVDEFMDNYYVN